jgi:DNA-binding NarL/FixJ family response regulator
MGALDQRISRFCAEHALSPQQTRIFTAMMHGALSNEALARRTGITVGAVRVHLERIARKSLTISRAELIYLFFTGNRGE